MRGDGALTVDSVALQPPEANCSVSGSGTANMTIVVIVPYGGRVSAAVAAISRLALDAQVDFGSAAFELSTITGCPASSFAFLSVSVATPTCGGGSGDVYCMHAMPQPSEDVPFVRTPAGMAVLAVSSAIFIALLLGGIAYALNKHHRASAVRAAQLYIAGSGSSIGDGLSARTGVFASSPLSARFVQRLRAPAAHPPPIVEGLAARALRRPRSPNAEALARVYRTSRVGAAVAAAAAAADASPSAAASVTTSARSASELTAGGGSATRVTVRGATYAGASGAAGIGTRNAARLVLQQLASPTAAAVDTASPQHSARHWGAASPLASASAPIAATRTGDTEDAATATVPPAAAARRRGELAVRELGSPAQRSGSARVTRKE